MIGSTPAASVIVPTRDRPAKLAACLAAIEAQTMLDFEAIVVDDGSSDPVAVASVVEAAPHARLLVGEGRGPARARNLGAAAARSPILCFTDDDCRPDPGWLGALLARFDTGADVVAGRTRNGQPGDVFGAASQLVTNHLTDTSYDASTGSVGFAPTCNVGCRRRVHEVVPFDEAFPLAAGEDRDWCSRLAELGIRLAFEPTAEVAHHQDLRWGSFWRQHVRYGRGGLIWRRTAADAGLQRRSFYVGLLSKGYAMGPRTGSLVVATQVATAVGLAQEAFARRGSSSRAVR